LTCRVVLVRYEGERGTHCPALRRLAGANRLARCEQPAAVVVHADSAPSARPEVREPVS
jgi:hypothetical protein